MSMATLKPGAFVFAWRDMGNHRQLWYPALRFDSTDGAVVPEGATMGGTPVTDVDIIGVDAVVRYFGTPDTDLREVGDDDVRPWFMCSSHNEASDWSETHIEHLKRTLTVGELISGVRVA